MEDNTIDYNSSRVLILGAGKEGQATLQYFQKQYPGAALAIADQQEVELDTDSVTTFFGKAYRSTLDHWDVVIVSPGIPPDTPILQTASHITTSTNIFFEDCAGLIIGVTGSKGKSTSCALIYNILQTANIPSHLVGNIGNASLATLMSENNKDDVYVFELSSYQTSRLHRGPDIALITNLFPDHLDYHGGVDAYYNDKMRITYKQTPEQIVLYNQDNEELRHRVNKTHAQRIHWPANDGAHRDGDWIMYGSEQIIKKQDIPLLGDHNINNVLGAIMAVKELQKCVQGRAIENSVIAEGIQSFTPLPHRLQPVGQFKNITFYDDSISTTPESTIAALNTVAETQTILLGGTDRGYNFSQLAHVMKEKDIQHVVLFPYSGESIEKEFKKIGYRPLVLHTRSMKEAVKFAFEHTTAGGACLLSCASPSYSVFKNFEDRGDQFQQYIRQFSAG